MGHAREELDAVGSNVPAGQPRSKVEFADLCGSLEDLVYLGEGSNGVVYSASWHGARVAVKFVLGKNDDGTFLQRCLTEAVLTRVLSHPCVVQCFATAISQLSPEVLEAIRDRCRRHASILQSCSLGRSMAAAVLQQEQQERSSAASHWEHVGLVLEQQQLQEEQQQQQQQQQQDRLSPDCECGGGCGGGCPTQQGGYGGDSSADVAAAAAAVADLQKMRAFFAEDLDHHPSRPLQPRQGPCLPPSQPQQQQQHAPPPPMPTPVPLGLSARPCSGGAGISLELMEEDEAGCGGGGSGGEGIGLMQALLDLKAEAGRHCTLVVMEYMDAGTLHQAIVRGDFSARRSSEHRAKLLSLLLTALELAQGMAHLHALDILHGDLKPTNVLLKGSPCQWPGGGGGDLALTPADPRGYTSKIADLGLARPCSGETAELSSDQWGALAYLAPEAAKGSCCKASDVYSFGVMLWEMSAGVRPYLGLTTPQVLMGLVTGQLQLTWPSDGSLYGPLRSLAIACTDFNPAERPTFEVAARILLRMVRHIRSTAEPLRQRHSSALSMEAASSAAAAAAAATMGPRGCGHGGSLHSPGSTAGGGGGQCMLNHAARSMPIYLPTASGAGSGGAAAAAASSLRTGPHPPTTPSGAGSKLARAPVSPSAVSRRPSAISAAAMAAASRSCGGGGGISGGATAPSFSGAVLGVGAAGAGAGPAAGAFWAATAQPAAVQQQPLPYPYPYPRTRRAAGGGVCGGAVLRSPLGGGDAGNGGGGGGMAASRVMPAAPGGDPRAGRQLAQVPVVLRAARGRPGSSPAHAHVMEMPSGRTVS